MRKVVLISLTITGILVSLTGAVATSKAAVCIGRRCISLPTPTATPITPITPITPVKSWFTPRTPTPTATATPTNPTMTPTPVPTPTATPTPISKPDLVITNVYPQTSPLAANWFFLMVNLKNQGTAKSIGISNIYVQITGAEGFFYNVTSCEAGLPNLNPGESATTSLNCIVYNPGMATAVVTVDAYNAIPESNESNNTFTLNFNVTP